MKLFLLLAAVLVPLAATAQSITLSPTGNALAVPRTASVAVTLATPPPPGATLKVFSSLAGGQKAGVLTTTSTGLSFQPTTPFKAGETVFATYSTGTGSRRVWQFTTAANGSGVFGGGSNLSWVAYPYGATLLTIAIGDLTSDGNLDVAAAETGTNPGSLFAGNGAGQFSHFSYFLPATYSLDPFPPFGDVNGDGLLDLVVRRNTGPASFVSIPNPTPLQYYVYGGVQADIDGDGDLDYLYTSSSQLYVAINNGAGTYTFTIPVVPLTGLGLLSVGDLDGDGDLDLVSSIGGGTLDILTNDGQGAFTKLAQYSTYSSSGNTPVNIGAALGDVDGDGDLDIITSNGIQGIFPAAIWLNNGQGVFIKISPSGLPTTSPTIVLGDVDGDGDLDALTSGSTAQLFLNNGTGMFTAGYTVLGMNANGGALLADMNNDGALDIVLAQPGTTPGNPGTGQPGILAVRLNNYIVTATQAAAATPPVSAWPNPVPAGATVHLEAGAPGMPGATRVAVQTVVGRTVYVGSFAGPSTDLPTTGMAPGLYLLTVQGPGEAPRTQQLVVE
ncbi:MAG: FG-GAP repeat domain-containing protein [Janthinobacterium lividum]